METLLEGAMANFFPARELPAKPDTAMVADAAAAMATRCSSNVCDEAIQREVVVVRMEARCRPAFCSLQLDSFRAMVIPFNAYRHMP